MSMFWRLGDYTLNPGSAIEKRGCALVIYDVNQASILQVLSFAEGRACDANGAEDIVADQAKNKPNEFACGMGASPFGGPPLRVRLVYAETEAYKRMWLDPAEKCKNPFAKDAQSIQPEIKAETPTPQQQPAIQSAPQDKPSLIQRIFQIFK